MIDLHLHTTASDGRLTAAELVSRAAAAGLTVMSVTDHDTVASIDESTTLARKVGIRVVPGIEVTAVQDGRDIHVLAYFLDHHDLAFGEFLRRQRALRVDRIHEMAAKLSALGAPIDIDEILATAAERPGASVGRPVLARALLAAGHVTSLQDAFDRFLGSGQPAFVPRIGSPPADVVAIIHRAGGIASLAHPGVTRKDEMIPVLADEGLDALEVFHSDHAPAAVSAYGEMAARLGLAVSGGSDFHGYGTTRDTLGRVFLPDAAFEALEARVPA